MFIMDLTFYDDLTMIYLLYYQLFNIFRWTISLHIHEISSLCSHIDHNKNSMSSIIKQQLFSKKKRKLTTCLLIKMNIPRIVRNEYELRGASFGQTISNCLCPCYACFKRIFNYAGANMTRIHIAK